MKNLQSGNIDKSSPILFRNFLIEGDVLPSTFCREHLEKQIFYLIKKYISPKYSTFIKHMTINDITKTSCVVYITMIDNKKYNRKIEHIDYIFNKSDVKQILKDILYTTKKNLKRNSKIILDNNSKSTSSIKHRSIKSHKSNYIHSRHKHNSFNLSKSRSKSGPKIRLHRNSVKSSKHHTKRRKLSSAFKKENKR